MKKKKVQKAVIIIPELMQLMLPGEVFLPELFLHNLKCFCLILILLKLSLQWT